MSPEESKYEWNKICIRNWLKLADILESWTCLVVKSMKEDGSYNTPIDNKTWQEIHEGAVNDLMSVMDVPHYLSEQAIKDVSVEDELFECFVAHGCTFEEEKQGGVQ